MMGCAKVAHPFHCPRMRSPAASIPRANLLNAVLLGAGLLPIVLMLVTVLRTWLPLPYWDEWSTPAANLVDWCQGHLTFQELFSQHNESRKLFPRLLYLGLAQLGGWDVRKEMAITFLLVCAIAFLFYRLLRQTPGATTRAALLAWIPAAYLCFSPVQLENFLWGVQLEVFLPGVALLGLVAVNLSRLSLAQKGLLNGLLAFLCTFTVAHGMLLWLLGLPFFGSGEKPSRRRLFVVYGLYLLCAAAAITAYFIGYQRPAHHPHFLAGHPGVLKLAHYLILWVGSYFRSTVVNPFAVGLVAIALLATALAVSGWIIWKDRTWRAFYPGLLIVAYTGATAFITAIGRIGFGVEQALDTRYRTYSLFFYLGLISLLFTAYCLFFKHARPPARRLFLGGALVLALVAALGWLACYREGLAQQRLIAQRNLVLIRALEWIEVVPDNPELKLIFPLPEYLRERVRLLRECDLLRLPFVSEQLARAVGATPHPVAGESYGQLETCEIDSNHNLWIQGRAQLPGGQPPDCVVIGAVDARGVYKPISIMETRRPRGGGKTRAPQGERVLFGRTLNPANLPPGDVTIAAWSVDLQNEQVYPLAGVTFIPATQR